MKVPRSTKTIWHPWFAWFPVKVGPSTIFWEWVERRDTCEPGTLEELHCSPIWEYREPNA